jgi:hypothetical protein
VFKISCLQDVHESSKKSPSRTASAKFPNDAALVADSEVNIYSVSFLFKYFYVHLGSNFGMSFTVLAFYYPHLRFKFLDPEHDLLHPDIEKEFLALAPLMCT